MFIITAYNYEGRDFSWDGRNFDRYWGGFGQTVLDVYYHSIQLRR
nr:MAG TPA: hypothetical protein [Caudoviricetes sp.]